MTDLRSAGPQQQAPNVGNQNGNNTYPMFLPMHMFHRTSVPVGALQEGDAAALDGQTHRTAVSTGTAATGSWSNLDVPVSSTNLSTFVGLQQEVTPALKGTLVNSMGFSQAESAPSRRFPSSHRGARDGNQHDVSRPNKRHRVNGQQFVHEPLQMNLFERTNMLQTDQPRHQQQLPPTDRLGQSPTNQLQHLGQPPHHPQRPPTGQQPHQQHHQQRQQHQQQSLRGEHAFLPSSTAPQDMQSGQDGTGLAVLGIEDKRNKGRTMSWGKAMPNFVVPGGKQAKQSKLSDLLCAIDKSDLHHNPLLQPLDPGSTAVAPAAVAVATGLANPLPVGTQVSSIHANNGPSSTFEQRRPLPVASSGSDHASMGATQQEQELMEKIKKKHKRPLRFQCPHPGCNKRFAWKWSMAAHAKTHLGDAGRVFKCDQCSKGFFTIGSLKAHVRIHERKDKYIECPYEKCNKSYKTQEGLRLHVRNHHQVDKPFTCPHEHCKKQFVRQSDLRLHVIRMHVSAKPFPCDFPGCNKSFACLSEKRRHAAFHE